MLRFLKKSLEIIGSIFVKNSFQKMLYKNYMNLLKSIYMENHEKSQKEVNTSIIVGYVGCFEVIKVKYIKQSSSYEKGTVSKKKKFNGIFH